MKIAKKIVIFHLSITQSLISTFYRGNNTIHKSILNFFFIFLIKIFPLTKSFREIDFYLFDTVTRIIQFIFQK